jgi:hypothetical protein
VKIKGVWRLLLTGGRLLRRGNEIGELVAFAALVADAKELGADSNGCELTREAHFVEFGVAGVWPVRESTKGIYGGAREHALGAGLGEEATDVGDEVEDEILLGG